jgi:hypothetical protein
MKTTLGEDYSEFLKGIRERLTNSFNHGACTKSLPSKPTHSDHPLDPEEEIQSLTLKLAFLRLGSSCLWSSICLQVIHNHGHGFSKRFNPAGVHNFSHTWWSSPGPSERILAGWWSPTTFTLHRPIPWGMPKGLSLPSQDGRSPMWNLLLWVEIGLPEESTSINLSHVSICMHLFHHLVSKHFRCICRIESPD